MHLTVNNVANTDIILTVDGGIHLIKATDTNVVLAIESGYHVLSVRREQSVPLPDAKRLFWSEFLGPLAALLIKPVFYVFDVSSSYVVDMADRDLTIQIIRKTTHSNPEGIYDVIDIDFLSHEGAHVRYNVENRKALSAIYDKSKRKGHFWLYVVLEVLFTLVGLAITYPPLLVIGAATNAVTVKLILAVIPFFLMGIIALIGILPLHFLFRFQDRQFYRAMEEREISSYLMKHSAGKHRP